MYGHMGLNVVVSIIMILGFILTYLQIRPIMEFIFSDCKVRGSWTPDWGYDCAYPYDCGFGKNKGKSAAKTYKGKHVLSYIRKTIVF